jgi:hypothetical protein
MKKLLFILGVSAFIGCGPSTQMVKSWHEPSSTLTSTSVEKILVLGMVKDEASRRIVEDNLVKRLSGKAVASYGLLPIDIVKGANKDDLENKLKQGGFTHVLLVRLADVEKETSYVPGTQPMPFYGGYGLYYGYGAAMYGTPGYYTEDKNYFVETAVYSINPNKLLWTGTTKTVNPSKMDKTVNEIADAVSLKMKEDGFWIK